MKNVRKNSRTHYSLVEFNLFVGALTTISGFAVILGAVCLGSPAASFAQEPARAKIAGRLPAPETDPQFKAIQARAGAAAVKMNVKDPKSIKAVNTELANVRAELDAYAKAKGLKLTTTRYRSVNVEKGSSGSPQCRQIEGCVLTRSGVTERGAEWCEYTCTVNYGRIGRQ
jgi:hypothetical protein